MGRVGEAGWIGEEEEEEKNSSIEINEKDMNIIKRDENDRLFL